MGFLNSKVRLRLIKLLLPPVSTIAQQSWFSTWTGSHIPLPLTISPDATASVSLSLHLSLVHFFPKLTWSILLKDFAVWGSGSGLRGFNSRLFVYGRLGRVLWRYGFILRKETTGVNVFTNFNPSLGIYISWSITTASTVFVTAGSVSNRGRVWSSRVGVKRVLNRGGTRFCCGSSCAQFK